MKLFGKNKSDDFLELKNKGLASYRMGQLDKAVNLLSQAINLQPADPEAVYMRGMAYARMGNLHSAIQDFECMYAMPTPSRLNKRDACYNLGKAYDELNQWDEALLWYNRVTELDPNFDKVYANRGGVHLKVGNAKSDLSEFELAVADLTTALSFNPNDAVAYFNRALANARTQNFDPVSDDLQKFLELAPANHPFRKDVESLLAEAEKPTSAKLDMLREKKQKDLYQRIIKANDEQRFADAVSLCDQYLEDRNTEADVWNEKAVALWCMDRTQEALTVILEGISHNPGDAFLYYTKGDLLAALGHYREAVGAFEKYLATSLPNDEKVPKAREKLDVIKRRLSG